MASQVKEIFIIQVYKRNKRDEEHPTRGSRTIGWYSTFKDAEENLHANKDIFAEVMDDYVYYPYALIERVPEGPYSCGICGDEDNDVKFYEWKDGDYVPCERPKELQGVIGLTMG